MRRRHYFHILLPSPWPLLLSLSILLLVFGLVLWMNLINNGGYYLLGSLVLVLLVAYLWVNDIIEEATCGGYHSTIVKLSIRNGFQLFVISEVMLFLAFFWAFFHSALCPSNLIGSIYPPKGIIYISPWGLPLLNTMLLIVSGFAVTWAHRCICVNYFKEAIDSFLITILLGMVFMFIQAYEYYEAAFDISDGIYGSVFYFLTGLHGMHVFVGILCLIFSFIRLVNRHFLRNHYLGFVLASWYWHFVDIVWIALFLIVYVWGNW